MIVPSSQAEHASERARALPGKVSRRGTGPSRDTNRALCRLALSVAACSNPFDPTQRAVGGGLLGAGAGAAIGGLARGGTGAVVGGLAGDAFGAVGGVATTPQPQRHNSY
jgi:hypothetical protein